MIKILTLGILASALVWFFVSEDRVRSYIEWDLKKQLAEVVTQEDVSKVNVTVAGRDVIIQQRGAASPQEISLIREQIYSVPGVGRVLHVDGFKDESAIRSAISALAGAKNKSLFASVKFSEEVLTLTGNVAAPQATGEVLGPLIDSYGLRVNNYLSFHGEIPPRRWLTFLNAFANLQPLGTTGEVLITDAGISIVAEDQALAEQILGLLKADGVDLPMRIVNRSGDSAGDGNGSPPVISVSAAECNEELAVLLSGNSIAFGHGDDKLKSGSLLTLQAVGKLADNCKGLIFLVEGFTDNIGSSEYNRNLSQRRADAVKARLVQYGVSPSAIDAVGVGEDRPIASNETREGRQRNRRIELKFFSVRSSLTSFGSNKVANVGSGDGRWQNTSQAGSGDTGTLGAVTQFTKLSEISTASKPSQTSVPVKIAQPVPATKGGKAVEFREIQGSGVDVGSNDTLQQQREIFFEERKVE